MIKILLLAVVPFITQHRNVAPKTEVSTNFYGSVTGIVDKAYIEARVGAGGGGCDTNAVDALANSAVVTNALTVATTNRVALLETATDNLSYSVSDLESSVSGLQSSVYDLQSSKLDKSDVVAPSGDSRDGQAADAKVVRAELDSILNMANEAARDANTALYDIGETKAALNNVKITADDALCAAEKLEANKADKADISSTNPTFSNAVLAVGLNIDTSSVAVLNEIAENFGGFPLGAGETATTVGGLLAALAAAVAWMKKNKVGSFASVGGASATVENGVAKLSDFFTESNSLLRGTIDARLPYPLYAVLSTGLLKDRAINTTSLASVTVPDNFTDLIVRASVSSSLAVTMPAAITKYGDTFPGEAGEYLITITKTGAAEAYVRTIKLEEVANA